MKFEMRGILLVIGVMIANAASAHDDADWLQNTMFQSGKINVVVAVIAVVFILLVGYLIMIDRKLKRLEKRQKNQVK